MGNSSGLARETFTECDYAEAVMWCQKERRVSTMEGIILSLEALASRGASSGGCPAGHRRKGGGVRYMEEEEKAGRRLFWVDWPIPGTERPLLRRRRSGSRLDTSTEPAGVRVGPPAANISHPFPTRAA